MKFSTGALQILFLLIISRTTSAFQLPSYHCHHTNSNINNKYHQEAIYQSTKRKHRLPSSSLKSYNDDNNNTSTYSRELRLREEAESPFRKVRFFAYVALAGGAMTSLIVSATRILAALNNINTDLMDESITNAGVDILGLGFIYYFYQQDLKAQESRLKRAQKGAEFAKLMIRLNTNTIPLSSLRSGRGLDKRVVIAAAGRSKITQILEECDRFKDNLRINDLVVVPVITPQCTAPFLSSNDEHQQTSCNDVIALPAGGNWNRALEGEIEQAIIQDIDVENDGFAIVLKKNGKIGQRTKGINLAKMCGEVDQRRQAGMDVTNI